MSTAIGRIARVALTALLALSLVLSGAVWAFPFAAHASGGMEEARDAGIQPTDEPDGAGEEKPGGEPQGEEEEEENDDGSGDEQNANGDDPPGAEGTGEQDALDNAGVDIAETGLVQEPEEREDVVYNGAELAAWLAGHRVGGGRVSLGGVVTLTETILLHGCGHIVIDTGEYGLIYGRGGIYLLGYEEFSITGEGVDVPVLDIYDTGGFNGGWNRYTRSLTITATGRDGTGGIALRVMRDDNFSTKAGSLTYEGHIRSYGEGAVGLYLAVPLDAYGFNIEVEGAGSAAVYAEQGANLYYCKLKARGAGEAVVSGAGDILLDTCAALPAPQNGRIVNYHIVDVISGRFYEPVQQNSPVYLSGDYTFLLNDETGASAITSSFSIQWDDYRNIDTGKVGTYVVQGSLAPPLQGLGLEGGYSFEFMVEVCDPALPMICDLEFWGNSVVYIYFWYSHEQMANGDMILWRSDNGGESWYDFTDSTDISWNIGGFMFCCDEITDPITLQLERVDVGVSNVITLYSIDGIVRVGDSGGDRTGTDRVVVGGDGSGAADNDDNSVGDGSDSNAGSRNSTGGTAGGKDNSGSGSYAGNADNDGGETQANTGSGAAAILPDAGNAPAAEPVVGTAVATASVIESLPVQPGPGTEEQTAPAGTPAAGEYAAIPPQPDATGPSDVPERTASKSTLDARGWIALSGLATILFAGAYIRLRPHGAGRRRT